MATVKSLLSKLNLGTSVAEFDEDLESYFVETNVFREFIRDKVDIIAGDKGTGKTAIYRFINKRHKEIKELEDVLIIPAFNPSGNPIFSKLTEQASMEEAKYVLLWKSYILSLVGNTLIQNDPLLVGSDLDKMLKGLGLKTPSVTPKNVFAKILGQIPNFLHWKSAEVQFSLTESGLPAITPKVEFSAPGVEKLEAMTISAEDAFAVLDAAMPESDVRAWVTFDRLDEAFQGHADIEVTALRGLLRTYLDLTEFARLKLKLFLRRDLFRRITSSGFVNLTHINAKKLEIIWDEEDLLNLLARRIRQNDEFVDGLGIRELSDQEMFDRIFPDQVDFGLRKPKTWVWMMRRVRDGNDVKPPRNLIDLIKFSREAQLRKEDRDPRENTSDALIEPDALRKGLSQLSESRVNDTLLAEAGTLSPVINRFRDGKAEHNVDSLADVLSLRPSEVRPAIKPLLELGFLEDIKGTYKIPTLYREGLGVTQGKAFQVSDGDDED
ncbi:MAG TPA: hypothetical protein VNJ10_05270 [Sphingomonas sp.]|nr:hypothetical protein [Sphingomonas sp.]